MCEQEPVVRAGRAGAEVKELPVRGPAPPLGLMRWGRGESGPDHTAASLPWR